MRFFDVGAGGIAALIGTGMATQLGLPAANTSTLVSRLRFMFQKWPRLVAEYKPAFGSVFAQYLANYTHWGYSDLDVVLGDLSRFVSRSELRDHHIVNARAPTHPRWRRAPMSAPAPTPALALARV